MHAVLTNLIIVVGFLPEIVLANLSQEIAKEYRNLAMKLSVTYAKLDAINIDKNSVTEKALEALLVWNRGNSERSMCDMFNILYEKLKEVGRSDLAETIEAG